MIQVIYGLFFYYIHHFLFLLFAVIHNFHKDHLLIQINFFMLKLRIISIYLVFIIQFTAIILNIHVNSSQFLKNFHRIFLELY